MREKDAGLADGTHVRRYEDSEVHQGDQTSEDGRSQTVVSASTDQPKWHNA